MKTQDDQFDAVSDYILDKYGLRITQGMVKRFLSMVDSDNSESWADVWGMDAGGIPQVVIVTRDEASSVIKNRR
jgi:hypothetical protein